MSDNSAIEWTNTTWNPTTGCDRVSPGCDHCYALTLAKRLKGMGSAKYQRDGDPRTSGPGFGLTVHPDTLHTPLTWRKPRKVFVNSMSDLFHKDVPEDHIAKVWTTMAATPQHTYQILTKRHARMRSVVRRIAWRSATTEERQRGVRGSQAYVQNDESLNQHLGAPRVLPNVWLGVSVEDQKWADIRIPALLDTPAAVRFLSAEPLLGPVDLSRWLGLEYMESFEDYGEELFASLVGKVGPGGGLHWVIVGGESGPGARPMHPSWVRTLRDQCTTAGTAFFFKQFGAWVPESEWLHRRSAPAAFLDTDGRFRPLVDGKPLAAPMARGDAITVRQVGKKAAGREIDGRTWDEFPGSIDNGVIA